MKIGIFSDVHGNQYAWRAFLSMLPQMKLDELIFCGDIFGYYYGQKEIIRDLSIMTNLTWMRGNHDQYFLDIYKNPANESTLVSKYGTSYKNIREKIEDWEKDKICKTNLKTVIKRDNINISVSHGVGADYLEGRFYPEDMYPEIINVPSEIVLFGHTHFRMSRKINGCLWINPGSLGQARDSLRPSIAVLTLPEKTVEFIDILYSVTELEQEVRQKDPQNKKLIELLHRWEVNKT